jgi:anti-sigma B factor antagonist
MGFDITQHKDEAIIKTMVEKLDVSNSSELKAILQSLNKVGVNKVIIDFSLTRYCDSSGLSAVLVANRLCKDSNGSFIMCGLTENVLKVIQISQLDKVLLIESTLEDAISTIRS